mmetsp:Transcript_122575/g.357953  ORF Transcript_122575/g.357953 Transcript_122575/m.357953 type:complete len:228 (-) Transcript_122575:1853-2536(-)
MMGLNSPREETPRGGLPRDAWPPQSGVAARGAEPRRREPSSAAELQGRPEEEVAAALLPSGVGVSLAQLAEKAAPPLAVGDRVEETAGLPGPGQQEDALAGPELRPPRTLAGEVEPEARAQSEPSERLHGDSSRLHALRSSLSALALSTSAFSLSRSEFRNFTLARSREFSSRSCLGAASPSPASPLLAPAFAFVGSAAGEPQASPPARTLLKACRSALFSSMASES